MHRENRRMDVYFFRCSTTVWNRDILATAAHQTKTDPKTSRCLAHGTLLGLTNIVRNSGAGGKPRGVIVSEAVVGVWPLKRPLKSPRGLDIAHDYPARLADASAEALGHISLYCSTVTDSGRNIAWFSSDTAICVGSPYLPGDKEVHDPGLLRSWTLRGLDRSVPVSVLN